MVIPPFTPLTVEPKTKSVGCVLRQYQMNGAGLWDQITSEGTPVADSRPCGWR